MGAGSITRATLAGLASILLLAPAVLADTCCANTAVGLDPDSAAPGDTVRLTGLRCLAADNSGPLVLKLDGFWLSASERAPEAQPDAVPGPGVPTDLPPANEWHPFDTVTPAADGFGSATIIIPQVRAGTYQLWWTCDEGGNPSLTIHYSTGPRLVVSAAPDTATAGEPSRPGDPIRPVAFLLAAGFGLVMIALGGTRRRRRPVE